MINVTFRPDVIMLDIHEGFHHCCPYVVCKEPTVIQLNKSAVTHTHTDMFTSLLHPPSPPPELPFPLFLTGLFFIETLEFFPRVQRCCRGTNRLFCQIAKNFKVCLTCTLGRPALGVRTSHTETWGRVLKAPCISRLLTFKGACTLLSLTWLLWIKYVSSSCHRSFRNTM